MDQCSESIDRLFESAVHLVDELSQEAWYVPHRSTALMSIEEARQGECTNRNLTKCQLLQNEHVLMSTQLSSEGICSLLSEVHNVYRMHYTLVIAVLLNTGQEWMEKTTFLPSSSFVT